MKVGIVGVGNMGGPMVAYIAAAGELAVYDVRVEATAPLAAPAALGVRDGAGGIAR